MDFKPNFDRMDQSEQGEETGSLSETYISNEASENISSVELDTISLEPAVQNIDMDSCAALLRENLDALGFSEEEISRFTDILRDNQEHPTLYNRSFGSVYGGMVCITGSINCSGCEGPLLGAGLCRNGR